MDCGRMRASSSRIASLTNGSSVNVAVAWSCSRRPGKLAPASGWLFVAGTLLFSGSLYALALTGERALGVVTPLGGLAFLAGWLCLAWSAIRA